MRNVMNHALTPAPRNLQNGKIPCEKNVQITVVFCFDEKVRD